LLFSLTGSATTKPDCGPLPATGCRKLCALVAGSIDHEERIVAAAEAGAADSTVGTAALNSVLPRRIALVTHTARKAHLRLRPREGAARPYPDLHRWHRPDADGGRADALDPASALTRLAILHDTPIACGPAAASLGRDRYN